MASLSGLMAMSRVLRRLRVEQILARGMMRYRQWRFSRRGFSRAVPRHRQGVAGDWQQRLARWHPEPAVAEAWVEVAGQRLVANRNWLRRGAERRLRHRRELPRLELFYHPFLPGWKDGWDFVREGVEEFPARRHDRLHEWHPYSVSNRLAHWLEFLAGKVPCPDAQLGAEAVRICRQLTDYLDWLPELDIGANHLLKNRWAVALSDLLLEPSPARQERSVRAYLQELEHQLLPDGGHFELCPMYHAKVLADATLLARALSPDNPAIAPLDTLRSVAAGWLEHVRLGTNRWANFNDSWDIPGLAAKIWPDDDWTPESGIHHLAASGFISGRTAAGGWRWVFDVGGVGPEFNPGHCHSDVLSVILHRNETPLLVDPGTLHYSPNDERAFLKSCQAHNGPCLAERDHTEMVGSFRIGRAAHGAGAGTEKTDGKEVAFGHHVGYGNVRVDRRIEAGSAVFRMLDTWSPLRSGVGSPWSRMLWAVPLRPLRDVEVLDDHLGFRFPVDHPLGDVSVRIRVSGADAPRLCLAESFWSAEFGRTVEATETVVTAGRLRQPVTVETVISAQ